ncbi:organomercurial lyase [Mycobacterium sp.]|uniref:alkylmercury lyase family protein n=1 Tax=Mycobacterium sp. TaxID=1785 RepID=UPI003F955209
MAELSERARQVRKNIMDHTRGEGVVPTTAELCRELGLSADDLAVDLLNLEAAASVARQDSAHAELTRFQDEVLDEPLPPLGEIMYARPFAAFKNHYPVWVDGEQKWFAECAVEACSISAQFPGKAVTVRSVCRQTREPVELVGRDGVLVDYSPATLRVHLGYPLRTLPARIVGWCDYNSFFASEDAAQQWASAHPQVQGVTRSPETMSRLIGELFGRGRLAYDYQPAVPILDAVLHMKRYGLDKPTALGFRVPDPFFLPSLGMVRDWKRQGYGNYFRFSLR